MRQPDGSADIDTAEAREYNKSMGAREKTLKLIKYIVFCFAAAACALLFCGCHVFAWYIPADYSESEKQKIYANIKDELLTELPSYIAHVYYTEPDGETVREVNVWSCDGKVIMNFDILSEEGGSVYYDGVLRHWDRPEQTEMVQEKSLEEFDYVFDYINAFAEYLKTVIGTPYDDGYFHKCLPWGFGMAQIYYNDLDLSTAGITDANISASWTPQKFGPPVHSAEFGLSCNRGYINLQIYAEPYDIDERITNILNYYEEHKTPPVQDEEI